MTEDILLKKWLNDDLTDTEKEVFSKRGDYVLNQRILEEAKKFKASEFSKIDDFETFKVTYENKSELKSVNWIKPLLGIAAMFLVSLGIYFTLFNNNIVEERTLVGEKTTIILPDMSQVTLNAGSTITYGADTWDTKRQLNLKGEAYFRVAKGKVFDVVTAHGTVTVVGTEFNVKARGNYFEVVCYEGIVKVASDNKTRQLLAGDTYRILNDKFSEDKTNDIKPQWTTNRSRFKAVSFKEVINELERQYAVKVTFKDVNASRLFTGVFPHNNLENALFAITQPMNLTFEISSPNQVLIHGNTD